MLLRNPVLRAWSHWGHLDRKARGKNDPDAKVGAFRKRLRREAKALRSDPDYQDKGLSHIGRSLYAPQIERVRALFPPGQVLFIKSERFFADQHGVADEVCRFLGVSPLTAVARPPEVHANVGSGRGISPQELGGGLPLCRGRHRRRGAPARLGLLRLADAAGDDLNRFLKSMNHVSEPARPIHLNRLAPSPIGDLP